MRRGRAGVDRSTPVTELIAALSVCMLAASFGALLGPEWCRSWALFGTFGLVSAVGLDAFHRTRDRAREQRRLKEMAVAAERGLCKAVISMESSATIRDAIRKVQENAVSEVSRSPTGSTRQRFPSHKQVTITPVRGRPETSGDWLGDSIIGRVRDISSYGIGLAHSRPLDRGPVLLAFDLKTGEHICFIAELLWCEAQGDGEYASGGKLMDVLNPEEAESVTSLAAR